MEQKRSTLDSGRSTPTKIGEDDQTSTGDRDVELQQGCKLKLFAIAGETYFYLHPSYMCVGSHSKVP